MIMVPAENLSKHHQHLPHGGGSDGGCFYGYFGTSFTESTFNGYEYHHNEACLGSDLGAASAAANSMAEDESRTNSTVNEEGSSSKDIVNNNQEQQEQDKDWLQLGLGGGQATTTTTYDQYDHNNKHVQGYLGSRRGDLMELDLLPGGSSKSQQARPLAPMFHMPEFRPPSRPTGMHSFSTLFFQQQQEGSSSMIPPHHGEINWAIKPIPQHIAAGSSSSSLAPSWSYFGRPFQVQSMDVAGPSTELIRIIDPPRRPHSGLWFMLQASHNQAKEPFLPQIPKSYLRIKDGKMTVRLLMKYVANKLRLDSESEIEIRCRGEQLEPLMTLQHVRDQIWSSRQALALLPADYTSTTTTTSDINNNNNHNNNSNNNKSNSNNSNNNVMVLHYGRIS